MDRDDVGRLYDQHAAALYRFLVLRTEDAALAEDLVAEAFERVLRHRRRFDARKASESTWLFAIALNALQDRRRRAAAEQRAHQRLPATGADVAGPEEGLAPDERVALRAALGRLPDDEADAIALRYGAGMTVPELAKTLEIPLTTAEGRVKRGLRRLRDELGSAGGSAGES